MNMSTMTVEEAINLLNVVDEMRMPLLVLNLHEMFVFYRLLVDLLLYKGYDITILWDCAYAIMNMRDEVILRYTK